MAIQSHIDLVVKYFLRAEKKNLEEGINKLESRKKKK